MSTQNGGTGRRVLRALGLSVMAVVVLIVIGIGVGYLLTWDNHTMPKTTAQDSRLPSLTLDGYRFHAQAHGASGRPVVIVLHGGPGNDYRYLLSLRALENRYRVVFYDQRGSGLSPRVKKEELTLKRYLADLEAIRAHYAGTRSVTLIGHSWGAMLATAYTARNPSKVSRLVLAEPGILSNKAAAAYMQLLYARPGFKFLGNMIRSRIAAMHVSGPDDQAASDFFASHAFLYYKGSDHPLAGYYCNGVAPVRAMQEWRFGSLASMTLQSQARDQSGKFQMNLADGIEKWPGRALLIAGSCNKLIGARWQRTYHLPLFKRAQLKVIPNAGHMMFGERPEASLSLVRAFLAR